jgi:hypothetical protein
MSEGIGDRVHAIRRGLGPNARKPMSQEAFAELLTQKGTRRYYGPEISLIEQGKKELSLADAATIMAVDPLRRTIDWLQHGDTGRPIATIDIPDSLAIALSEQRKAERARTGSAPPDEPTAHPPRQAKVAGGRRGSNRPKDRR